MPIKNEQMRKLFASFIIFYSVLVYSQGTSNRFSEDYQDNHYSDNQFSDDGRMSNASKDHSVAASQNLNGGPGNPGTSVPIDGQLPLLLVAAGAFAIYYHRKYRLLIKK